MESCVSPHIDFLNKLLKNVRIISSASTQQIGCLVEVLFNIHRIPFNRTERNSIVKFLPIIRYIGKCRNPEKARDLLITFASHFIFIIVRAVLARK